jgi:hypothetical protein
MQTRTHWNNILVISPAVPEKLRQCWVLVVLEFMSLFQCVSSVWQEASELETASQMPLDWLNKSDNVDEQHS